ncbi:ATP-binding cassette sub-family B member 10, mitochondrial-like [Ptychodera flava]|uniref:ATP-binding cassette sub-family B member 10, mitochondrial-like n=1 Tax=Ptychodera flava TaxID=63121 RepID=UPI00396A4F60
MFSGRLPIFTNYSATTVRYICTGRLRSHLTHPWHPSVSSALPQQTCFKTCSLAANGGIMKCVVANLIAFRNGETIRSFVSCLKSYYKNGIGRTFRLIGRDHDFYTLGVRHAGITGRHCGHATNTRRFSTVPTRRTCRSSHSGQTVVRRTFCSKAEQRVNVRKPAEKKSFIPNSSEVARLLSLAKPEKSRLAGAILLLIISSGVTMSVPFCMGKIIDIINLSSDNDEMIKTLRTIAKILICVFLFGASANFGRVYLMQTSGQRIIKRLRESVFVSILRQDIAFFDKTKTGELINRLSADAQLVGQSVTSNVSDGLRATAQVIGGVGMMFYTSPQLASVVLAIVPPVAACAVIYGRYMRKITKGVQDSLATATEVADERISNIRTVRAFAQESRENHTYSTQLEKVLKLVYTEALARAGFFGMMGLSGNFIMLSVLYSGGMMMNSAQLTIGDLSAFLLYAGFVGASIGGLSSFYSELMKALGGSTRLWELIDRKPSIPLTDGLQPSLSELEGAICFNNVSFVYPSRTDMPILQNLNLQVPAGSVTAVVGSSGSGKSTLASLLMRFYDPDQGRITVDNMDIRSLSPDWLRNQIGVVSQDPVLFSSSIAENIAYGAPNMNQITTEEIHEAARKANAYQFVQAFPSGFDTLVGERGVMLSGGQRQRIAIARAILKNPKILLLDEATSALDAESEYLVQEALERVMVGRTVITIAHRLSTIKNANTIAVLQNGSIAELGSYDQLIALPNGIFRKLVERQTVMA